MMTTETLIRVKQKAIMLSIPILWLQAAAAWDGSLNLEPTLNRNAILLFEDFERIDFIKRWPAVPTGRVGAGVVSTPSDDVLTGNRSLYLSAKQGQHRSGGYVEYIPSTPVSDTAYMRLYLRLDKNFSMGTCNQLKLFGIRGGATLRNSYGDAGRRPNGHDKFSARVSIDRSQELHVYYYHPNQRGGWGDRAYCDGFFCSASLETGKGHCLELMLRPNTPRQNDGELAVWLDNERVIHLNTLRFRDSDAVKIRRFVIENYYGGGGRWNTSPQDQNTYIDNFVVSRARIGCLGKASIQE